MNLIQYAADTANAVSVSFHCSIRTLMHVLSNQLPENLPAPGKLHRYEAPRRSKLLLVPFRTYP